MALRKRCFKSAEDVQPGDWIYYKNERVWEGPIKIMTKVGKLLYAVRGGRLLTINSDHFKLTLFGEVCSQKSSAVRNINPVVEINLPEGESNVGEVGGGSTQQELSNGSTNQIISGPTNESMAVGGDKEGAEVIVAEVWR